MKKHKGRYQNPNSKNINRKYMSYEDVPLKEYRDNDPIPKNLTRKFLKIFLILFLSVMLVIALMNIDNLTPDNISHWFQYDFLGKTEGNGYPIDFSGTTVNTQNFDLIDGVPVYCSDTSITVLNSNAGEYQSGQHSFANPLMSTNAGYAIIYNSEATGFKIISRDKTIYAGSADDKIFSADISPNGTYAILTQGDDYLSKLTVYRKDHLEKYTYAFADYYVNRVSLNKEGTRAVLSGVSAKNGGLTSVIYILDFGQNKFFQRHTYNDSYIYDVKYLDNGNVIAAGEKYGYYIDVENDKESKFSYDSKTLTSYTLSRSYGMLLSLSNSPDGRNCDIMMINADGNKNVEISTGMQVLSLDYRNERIVSLFSSSATIYDLNGKVISNIDSSVDARKVRFSSDRTVYVLGKSRIFKYDFNK